jgi:hypothetical protein
VRVPRSVALVTVLAVVLVGAAIAAVVFEGAIIVAATLAMFRDLWRPPWRAVTGPRLLGACYSPECLSIHSRAA